MVGRVAARPIEAAFHLLQLDERGVPDEAGGRQLMVSVQSEEAHPEWVQLQAVSVLGGAEGDPRRPEVSDRWAATLHTLAAETDPSFGHLCDDATQLGVTALDEVIFRGGRVESMLAGREVLRGYSWVTVCPGELAARLGGVDALAASGAFARVEQLRCGGVWLQATKRFAEYDDAAVRRVFQVLAPVLPGGLPKPDPFAVHDGRTYRLVWEDAAQHRPAERAEPTEPATVEPLVTCDFAAAVGPGAGAVAHADEGYELRFERRLGHECAAVWRVLTDAAVAPEWLGRIPAPLRQPEYVIEPVVGGRVMLGYLDSTEGDGPLSAQVFELAEVVAAEAPVLFEYAAPGPDGPDVHERWQMHPGPDGSCRVSFTYVFQRLDRLALLLADWHCRLDAIALVLDCRDPAAAWDRWRPRYEGYRSLTRTDAQPRR